MIPKHRPFHDNQRKRKYNADRKIHGNQSALSFFSEINAILFRKDTKNFVQSKHNFRTLSIFYWSNRRPLICLLLFSPNSVQIIGHVHKMQTKIRRRESKPGRIEFLFCRLLPL